MNKNYIALLAVFLVALSPNPLRADPERTIRTEVIGGANDRFLVRITHGDKVKFEVCEASNHDVCYSLGNSSGYYRDSLIKARKQMQRTIG